MFTKHTIGLCLIVSTTSSCASIISKSTYPVSITSPTKGTEFTVFKDGTEITSGRTPHTVSLEASKGFFKPAKYNIKFNSSKINNTPLNAELDPWFLGNILFGFGGLIGGLIVDPLTGAMWKLPDSVGSGAMKTMDTEETSSAVSNQTTVISYYDVPLKYRDELVPVSN